MLGLRARRTRARGAAGCAAGAAGLAVTAALLALPAAAGAATSPGIDVGVGRADITPPTGYYMMGWVRSDGIIVGQHTRLWARVIVLREGSRKIALVAEDLNGIPGGMMADAANLDRDIGFSESNVLDSASHTHAAPTSFYNFSTYDSVFMTLRSPTDFDLAGTVDPPLYAFMVRRLALAIRRANANLGPGAVGWGDTQITNLTENRSIEAHLYDHGIHLAYGQGSAAMDPLGVLHTIDPDASVMRVDKYLRGRRVPVGMWASFANHGTVNKYQFTYFNEDHHGAATHMVEAAIRQQGKVPAGQDVVNAYGNTDEGDISSGLHRSGPAAADYVGSVEAAAFMRAWSQAGAHMQRTPPLDWRWTRMCWCGQNTPDGPVSDRAAFGLAEFTGSEEGRGPLFDVTRIPFEGDHLPVGDPSAPVSTGNLLPAFGPQGDKAVAPIPLDVPKAVPMMALRLGDRMLVSVPGEMTEDMGRRVRAAVLGATIGSGVNAAVIAGLANEYADYFTTPQEYDAQHYEGAATVYGRSSADALEQVLVELSRDVVSGQPAPAAYPYDPRNGVTAGAAPFSTGATTASVAAEPAPRAGRLSHPAFSWNGGLRGFDRPLDRAYVLVQRLVNGPSAAVRPTSRARRRRSHPGFTGALHWVTVDSDLGLNVLWSVDSNGLYRAEWEVPLGAPQGTYRFQVQANHYTLDSSPFRVQPSSALVASPVAVGGGTAAIRLAYPAAQVHEDVGVPPPDSSADLTYRPPAVTSGQATFLVGGRAVTVAARTDGLFEVPAPAGSLVEVRPGAARDMYGNTNAAGLSFTA